MGEWGHGYSQELDRRSPWSFSGAEANQITDLEQIRVARSCHSRPVFLGETHELTLRVKSITSYSLTLVSTISLITGQVSP
jgi:hypothetical protein